MHSEIQAMFPGGVVNVRGDEVNGLGENTVPVGNILEAGRTTGETDRIFYLVECEHNIYRLRVCKAGDWEDYKEFAVIHNVYDKSSPSDMVEAAKRREDFEWAKLHYGERYLTNNP